MKLVLISEHLVTCILVMLRCPMRIRVGLIPVGCGSWRRTRCKALVPRCYLLTFKAWVRIGSSKILIELSLLDAIRVGLILEQLVDILRGRLMEKTIYGPHTHIHLVFMLLLPCVVLLPDMLLKWLSVVNWAGKFGVALLNICGWRWLSLYMLLRCNYKLTLSFSRCIVDYLDARIAWISRQDTLWVYSLDPWPSLPIMYQCLRSRGDHARVKTSIGVWIPLRRLCSSHTSLT